MKFKGFVLTASVAVLAAACTSTPKEQAHDEAHAEETVAEVVETPASIWEGEIAAATLADAGEAAAPEGATVFAIDPATSTMAWRGSKPTEFHEGTISVKGGEFHVVEGALAGGKIVVDMNSIVNTDVTNEEYNGKLVGHLGSPDFFDIATYPEAVLEVVSVEGDQVTANLTIKDITNQVTFPATVEVTDAGVNAKARFSIDRTKWGVEYNSGSIFSIEELKDKLINDQIDFVIEVAAPAGA
ncbi:YceI family protein [Pontibacter sp. G13]|uniref:YceI family protein n=1 Tax=Pontibacter sp. G13 TaxID=3074898 RepID=UPI00288BBCB9|nr:YceI family protein [Pontibacter sp. G13]WNJ18012.1 YceI family protein [Pontibacter sp. G13]